MTDAPIKIDPKLIPADAASEHARQGSAKVCDFTGCSELARFQVGFIAPYRRVILSPHQMALIEKNKAFQMWLNLGVCGSCRGKLSTIADVLDETQMAMMDKAQTGHGRPTLEWRQGYLIFCEVVNGKPGQVTRVDGKVMKPGPTKQPRKRTLLGRKENREVK